ncbi:hypothetical protein Asal01_02326 [Fodinibius salicampi]
MVLGQSAEVIPDRLIIKYESDQRIAQLKAKLSTNPKNAVEQFLRLSGAQNFEPLFTSGQRQQLHKKNTQKAEALLNIHEITFNRSIDPAQMAAKVERMPGVEYAEPRYLRRLHFTPNDPTLEKFIEFHRFEEAWDLSTSDPNIVIAIVDGGVDYTHPELDDKLWVNQEEIPSTLQSQVDQNSDGTITSSEIKQYLREEGNDYNNDGDILLDDALHPDSPLMDNTDNDDNGYIDDLFGWDFWDSGSINQATPDNNPIFDGTDHGTHVAGIAAAETDNDFGIAAASFQSSYMAVKAGGTSEDPNSVAFGFQGILYAAEQGADVINCSWGGDGASQAEQDLIDYVTELGSVVISSSGNDGLDQVGFPAGYSKVVGVGSITTNNSAAEYSNYGYNLDVFATGSGIRSTGNNGAFVNKSGTSMAAPVVSGLAALIKHIHPDWSAERIGQQIRTSATPVDNANGTDYNHKLGRGKIEAFEALNTDNPGLRIVSSRFLNNENQKLQINQPGRVEIQMVNNGRSASNLNLQLQALSNQGIEIAGTNLSLSSLSTGDTTEVTFDLTITESFDLRETPTLRLDFSSASGNYEDFGIIRYDEFLYEVIATNRIKTSMAADGTIGFTQPINGSGGVGFIPLKASDNGFTEGNNMLFEGGLMIEIDDKIYDAVRTEDGQLSRDFDPIDLFTTRRTDAISDLDGHTTFKINSDTTHDATIRLETFAYDNPQLHNMVFLKYTLQNNSSFHPLKNTYVGLFNDWDIGTSSNNSTTYLASDSLLYLSDETPNSDEPMASVASLGPISSILAIDNTIEGEQDSLTFGLYDGFTDQEKSRSLKAQKVKTSVENTDASAVVASGPYTLGPNAEVTIGFLYAFGENPEELRSQINAGRQQKPFEISPPGEAVAESTPTSINLFQNYPNPFKSETNIRFDLENTTRVTLTIYDVLGRKVRVLTDTELETGTHFITFDAENLSSGVYFARLHTQNSIQTIPMTLIK